MERVVKGRCRVCKCVRTVKQASVPPHFCQLQACHARSKCREHAWCAGALGRACSSTRCSPDMTSPPDFPGAHERILTAPVPPKPWLYRRMAPPRAAAGAIVRARTPIIVRLDALKQYLEQSQ